MKRAATETYLRRATRGLWGRKRREVREELEAHLSERVTAYQIGGLAETEAVERVLLELGRPQEVSVGMARLYTLPTVLGSGAALAAACVAVVALLPKGAAQALPGTFYWPSVECVKALESGTKQPLENDCFSISGAFWVDQEALREVLEPQGVVIKKLFAGSAYSALDITFPNAKAVYLSSNNADINVYDEHGIEIPPAPGYFSFWRFVETVSFQNAVEIKGWDNPVFTISGASLQIGTQASPMVESKFYDNYLEAVFNQYLVNSVIEEYTYFTTPRINQTYNSVQKVNTFREVTVSLPPNASGVYGLITRLDLANPAIDYTVSDASWDLAFAADVARTNADSNVTFKVPKERLRLVDAFLTKQAPGAAVLVKLGGSGTDNRGWFEVVSPEQVTLEPIP